MTYGAHTLPSPATGPIDDSAQVFRFLLVFRWASLAPIPFAWLFPELVPPQSPATLWILALVLALNTLLTIFYRSINDRLQRAPWLLGLDLLFSAAVVAFTGGAMSGFSFYALSPILAAAFFFGLRGGLLAALVFTPLYLLAVGIGSGLPLSTTEQHALVLEIFSFYLIGVLFGYGAVLLDKLRSQAIQVAVTGRQLATSNADLQHMNQQLRLIQELTLSLQSSVDPVELQTVLLTGLADDMGYQRTGLATFDGQGSLTGWLSHSGPGSGIVGHPAELALDGSASPVAHSLRTNRSILITDGASPTDLSVLDTHLRLGDSYVVLPMHLRGNPVGVLLVGSGHGQPLTETDLATLALVGNHASVALGSLRLCIDRAQRLAVEEVRNRIAADIHDTVTQNLFGLAYGLNACNQVLEQNSQAVSTIRAQLRDLEPLAFAALHQVRSAILGLLPGGLDHVRFAAGLRKHMDALSIRRSVQFSVDVTPQFDHWPLELRHQLLLIAQEGVANIARHANAEHAGVRVTDEDGRAVVVIWDDGQGFDPAQVPQVDGIGIDGIRRRVESLGGVLSTETGPDAGVQLHIELGTKQRG